jgi:retinoid hydroxylase
VPPPLVDIPRWVWESGQLSSFVAGLAVEHGPVLRFVPQAGPAAGHETIYMIGPEANRFVLLSGREHFSHDLGWTPVVGETFGHGLLNMDPPEHTRHRALMNPAFTATFMAAYLPMMQRVIADRTTAWAHQAEIDVLAEAREITFDVAATALVGMTTGAEVDWLRERFYLLLHEFDFEGAGQVQAELAQRLLQLIDARRRAPPGEYTDDVLGMLVRAHDEEGDALSDEQLLAHVNILLIAGHETTTTMGAWLLYLLATHPDIAERLLAQLDDVLGSRAAPLTTEHLHKLPLLSACIREAGRFQSPVLLLPRGALSDFEFGGYHVAEGTRVYLAIGAGHRLPSVFAEPDRFDPDRFLPPREEDRRSPYALVTFGGGPRICLGINFAQVEVTALVAHVLRRYRLEPIPDRTIAQYGGIIQSLPNGIPLRVSKRS